MTEYADFGGVTYPQNNKWVKVTDRLPDNMEVVLCILDIGSDNEYQISLFKFENNCFFDVDSIISPYKIEDCKNGESRITHWMSLPEPPTKE